MKVKIVGLLLSVVMVLLAADAGATIVIQAVAAPDPIWAGELTQVNISISGLGSGLDQALGAFDLNLSYDPHLLSFVSGTIGDPTLGDQLSFLLPAVSGIDYSLTGTVNLFEVSFDDPVILDLLQANSFVLGTLVFAGIELGKSALELEVKALGDALGNPLIAQIINGRVEVPLPSSLVLLTVCLTVLGWAMTRLS